VAYLRAGYGRQLTGLSPVWAIFPLEVPGRDGQRFTLAGETEHNFAGLATDLTGATLRDGSSWFMAVIRTERPAVPGRPSRAAARHERGRDTAARSGAALDYKERLNSATVRVIACA